MCTFPDCRDDQDGFVSECSNLPMLLLLKSLIYSGTFVIVALFYSFLFFFAEKDWNFQKGIKVLRARVCMR